MESNAARVRQFHEAVGNSDPLVPMLPNETVLLLRRTLVEEESQEVAEAFTQLQMACSEEDKKTGFTALVHELVDLLYVTYGALVAFGVEPNEVFTEVHRANMQKVSGPCREDGKQLKPKDWQPADVSRILVAQKARSR